ncbi:MAG: ribose-phosphate pyrophosphokinase [Bacillota bacterium]
MDAAKSAKIPYGTLGIIVLDSCKDLGDKINQHLTARRKSRTAFGGGQYQPDEVKDTYLIACKNIRFSNGEGKVSLEETVRGKDIYIIADVGNYNCTYEMFGRRTYMGPDEHFQDIKRTICAIAGNARRISVIMPFLYAGRQHRRNSRESLDCAIALQELERLGVKNIITFDAHDPRVQNAIPLIGFESLHPTYDIIRSFVNTEKELVVDKSRLIIISPDTGAMDKAIYYASVLGVDVGLFYKRRDYTKIVNGKNPIIQHEYMGTDVEGKDVLIVDDIIASGESVLDIARELKKRNAANVYVGATFALFTEGVGKIKDYYAKGLIKRFYATNLIYVPEEIRNYEWFVEVDVSKLLSAVIDHLNYDESISSLFDATGKIHDLLSGRDKKP